MPKKSLNCFPLSSTPTEGSFSVYGMWSLPDDERSVPGTLKYEDGSITLETIGMIPDTESASQSSAEHLPIIVGRTVTNDEITLLDGFYTHRPMLPWEDFKHSYCSILMHRIVVGVQLPEPDDTRFDGGSCSFVSLPRWLSKDDVRTWALPYEVTAPGSAAHWNHPDEVKFELSDGTQIEMRCLLGNDGLSDKTLRRYSHLNLHTTHLSPVSWFVDRFHLIESLFAILIAHPIQLSRMRLFQPERTQRHVPAVSVYGYRTIIAQDEVDWIDMPTHYSDLKDYLPTVFGNLFALEGEMRTSFNMFTSSLREPIRYADIQFLVLMQCLEIFVRVQCNGSYVTKAEYRPIRDKVIAAIPAETPYDLRESMERSLQRAHAYSLQTMILEVVKGMSPDCQRLFCDKPEAFATTLVKTRNHYTHRGSANAKHVLEGRNLFQTRIKLNALLSVLFLRHLGVPESTIVEAFNRFASHPLHRERWKGTPEAAISS